MSGRPRCRRQYSQRDRATVVIYRDDLGVASERFVTEPFRHLQRYQPVLAATRVVGSLDSDMAVVRVTPRLPLPEKARVAIYRTRGPGRGAVAALSARSPIAVHAQFGVDAVQALRLARNLGVPLITTFHGYDVLSSPAELSISHRGRAYLAKRDRLASEGAIFLAVSHFIRSRLLELGFPPERTKTHYLGVDVAALRPAAWPGRGIVFVGRLIRAKGAHHLFAAARALPPAVVGSVTIVGDGPERAALEQEAARLEVPVHFTGHLDRDGVGRTVAAAAVLCAPSQAPSPPDTWTEALGLVNVEAQALGVPVVAHRVGGIPEAVRDGETGLLVEPGNTDALAAALGRLLSDPTLHQRLATAARRHAVEHFDIRRQTALLEQIYADLG
jgi:colanic acid/amylovoran biosynthesis glycosyltransferase